MTFLILSLFFFPPFSPGGCFDSSNLCTGKPASENSLQTSCLMEQGIQNYGSVRRT